MNEKNDRRTRSGACCPQETDAGTTQAEAVLADAIEEQADTRARRNAEFSDPICINTSQIYDSCRDRDCAADQRVYLTQEGQEILDQAINVKLKKAEVIWVFTDVEPLSFNRGYFSVDLKFFVLCTLECFCGLSNPTVIQGLTTYDKRVILYGSEGNSKIFNSRFSPNFGELTETWEKTDMPTVAVEVVEPVALTAKIKEEECCDNSCGTPCGNCCCGEPFPDNISRVLGGGDLVVDDAARQILVTYGLFFIVRLERDTQLLIDAVDFCIPTQECPAATEESPCALFNDIRFPIDQFFPPQKKKDCAGNNGCGCGCGRN